MSDFNEKLKNITLPFWMARGELNRLLQASKKFWRGIHAWLTWCSQQFDPLVCNEKILELIAYSRDISRFDGEPLSLYRKRVSFAFINACDAGSVAGFINIFERLGVGYVELLERQPDIEWDVIRIRVTDNQISGNPQLLLKIIRQYGRTCRRYQFEVLTNEKIAIRAGWDQGEYLVYPAMLDISNTQKNIYSAHL